MSPEIKIALESPRQEEVAEMIGKLDQYLNERYPADTSHVLSIDELDQPDVRFFVARRDSIAIGCGALRVNKGWGEVKRMFVLPEARGLKIGRLILDRIEEEARGLGMTCLRLETGPDQPEAIGLYRSVGFVERGPFGDCQESPYSVFMEKVLYASE